VATIADVARRAGVSIATVSRVLSPGLQPHPVNPETARRVREAAAALDFVPSAVARALVSRRSGLLGLVVPDLADPHYPQIARGAEDRARQEGWSVLVCNTLGNPQRLADYLRLLRARRVDAVVVSGGSSLGRQELDAIAASQLPAVLIGRPAEPERLPFVAVDNVLAAHDATMHLVQAGRRRVAHLAGPVTQTTMADRAAGYRTALAKRALPAEVVATDGSSEEGLRAARVLLDRRLLDRPDALFAATDRLAAAALAAAMDAGVCVPSQLAVIGFDDLPLAAYLRPSLSSVAQPAQQLGEAAIHLALQVLAGETAEPVVLPARLVLRTSSQC
jgi:DNA-binding LacI/PurR family transcriptional regulator